MSREQSIGSKLGLVSGGVCGYPSANWKSWFVTTLLRFADLGVDCDEAVALEGLGDGDDVRAGDDGVEEAMMASVEVISRINVRHVNLSTEIDGTSRK